jgi:membrane-associated phospholipid phosphatase
VRAGAAAALAAGVLLPLARRRLKARPALTVAACAVAPVGLAVLAPRTKLRDAALFGLQMWAFTMSHELPYDDPEALRRRLRIRYPIELDRVLGGGELPGVRLQRLLAKPGGVTALDRFLSAVHWAWFFEPHSSLVYILARDDERFARAARQMAATYDLGCILYFAVPTAPPWWASEEGHLSDEPQDPELRRLMVDVGERFWGKAWPRLYGSLGGNPWAAMPSLHFATSLLAALLLAESSPAAGAVGWGYAITLGFALVYLGEHYVTDLLAGAALVALVRRGEPLAEPLALRLSDAVQRLERIANG